MKNSVPNILNDQLKNAASILAMDNLYNQISVTNLDCSLLPDPNKEKELPESVISSFFSELHSFDKDGSPVNKFPCLYVFEIVNDPTIPDIYNAFELAKHEVTTRNFPAMKSNKSNSQYLYVGKRLSDVGGRMVEHLGYNYKRVNHGLQLAFWARKLNPPLILNVHILKFIPEMRPYLSAFETILANELKPMIGKHY
jgi:hypothetical protein